jgi:hypothetical protein
LAAIVIQLLKRQNRIVARSIDDPQDVAFLHDEQLLAVDPDLGSRPFPEEDAIAGLDIERDELASFIATTADPLL